MKTNKRILVFLFLLTVGTAFSQLKEKSSNDIDSHYNDQTLGLTELADGGYAVLQELGGDYAIYTFNESLELQEEYTIEDDFAPSGHVIYGIVTLGSKTAVLYELFEDGTEKLFASEFDASSGSLSEDHYQLAEFSVKFNDLGYFAYEFTSTGESLLIYYVQNVSSSEGQLIRFSVVDENFTVVSSFEQMMGHTNDLFAYADYAADDDGNVFVSGLMFADNGARKEIVFSDPDVARYQLLHIPAGSEEYETIEIDIASKAICSQSIAMDDDGNVIIAGLYSSEHSGFAEGTFVLTYDPFMEQFTAIQKEAFTSELIKMTDQSDTQDKYQRKSDYDIEDEDKEGLYNLYVKKVIYRDGRTYMFVEEPCVYWVDYWRDPNLDKLHPGKQETGGELQDLFPSFDKSASFWEGGIYLFVFDESFATELYSYVLRENKAFDKKDPLFISFTEGVYEGKIFVSCYERREHVIRFIESNAADPKETSNHFSSDYMPRFFHMLEVEKGFVYVSSDKKTFQLNSVKL